MSGDLLHFCINCKTCRKHLSAFSGRQGYQVHPDCRRVTIEREQLTGIPRDLKERETDAVNLCHDRFFFTDVQGQGEQVRPPMTWLS